MVTTTLVRTQLTAIYTNFNAAFGWHSAEGVSVMANASETVAFIITAMYNVRKSGWAGLEHLLFFSP